MNVALNIAKRKSVRGSTGVHDTASAYSTHALPCAQIQKKKLKITWDNFTTKK